MSIPSMFARRFGPLLAVFAAALLLATMPALGQEKAKKKQLKPKPVIGVLTSVDEAAKTVVLEVDGPKDKALKPILKLADDGKVLINGTESKLGDLKPGMTLTCTIDSDGDIHSIRAYPPAPK